jgi:hypothetical protein
VARSSGAWSAFYRAGTVRGERTREVTGRRRVVSINGDCSSKGRQQSGRFMRGNEEETMAHRFNYSRVETGGARRRTSPAKEGGGYGVGRWKMTGEMGQMGCFGRMGRLGSQAGEGFQAKFKDLSRWVSDLIFELISRILSLKSKVSNISN